MLVNSAHLAVAKRCGKAILYLFILALTCILWQLIVQNFDEQRKWKEYSLDNNCYISSQLDDGNGSDEHGGRLATNPVPKEWSCDNGLKFKRY